jgi:quinol monooxygenase YgiN
VAIHIQMDGINMHGRDPFEPLIYTRSTEMSLSTFVVIARIALQPGALAAFLPVADADARDSLAQEPGCIAFNVLVPEDDEDCVVFHEIYRDREAFDLHLTQPHFHTFERDAKHLMAGKPQIEFFGSYVI